VSNSLKAAPRAKANLQHRLSFLDKKAFQGLFSVLPLKGSSKGVVDSADAIVEVLGLSLAPGDC